MNKYSLAHRHWSEPGHFILSFFFKLILVDKGLLFHNLPGALSEPLIFFLEIQYGVQDCRRFNELPI